MLVATSAFGMGIDYSDVRLIVHFGAPGSVEAYYQEAGRAGRDGEPAHCLLLFGPGDLMTQRRLAQRGGNAARTDAALAAIEGYARGARCRQVMLCAHFTGVAEHVACGACDVCAGTADADEVDDGAVAAAISAAAAALPDDVRAQILAACGALPRPVGKGTLAKALRGSQAKAVVAAGLGAMPWSGTLNHVDEAVLVAELDRLLAARRRCGRRTPAARCPRRWRPP